MHDIEPHILWRDQYIASEDARSPFFNRKYSEFYFENRLYNFYLHPQWDEFGSSTLYAKILFVDYGENYALIELIGEWNDTLHDDIMYLKRNIGDRLMAKGVYKMVFFCDNVLNFHAGDDDYYAEWAEELRDEGGWVTLVNLRPHVVEEMEDAHLDRYIYFGENYNDLNWRPHKPQHVFQIIEALLNGRVRRLEI